MMQDTAKSTMDVNIRDKLRPGDWGALISLHGSVYCTEYGFAPAFEAFVAGTVAEFVLDSAAEGKVWLAESDNRLVGCTAAVCRRDESRDYGQIRWVLLHPSVRGQGLGRGMLDRALTYCRNREFDKIRLETTDGLDASQRLYLQAGFELVEEVPAVLWGERRRLITMELDLAANPTRPGPD